MMTRSMTKLVCGCLFVIAMAVPARAHVFVECPDPILWPPNHKLVSFDLSITTDFPDPIIEIEVYSDEDDLTRGAGNHSPDAKVSGDTVRLRSERSGRLDGRVYLIVVTAYNDGPGFAQECCTVVVPHDMSEASIASALAQAEAAKAYCPGIPPGFVSVTDGPIVGPKQ